MGLKLLNVKKGDKVITPLILYFLNNLDSSRWSKTFFTDVLYDQNIDPKVEKRLQKNKAIMPVHLTGRV